MQPNKFLSPDAAETGGNTSPKIKKSPKNYNPNAMSDMVAVNTKVNEKWAATPVITLLWITQPDFEKLVNDFSKTVSQQSANASARPAGTQSLLQMDATMNETVKTIKRAIDFKFGDLGTAQYARYGIIKESKNYRLPKDRDLRLQNLDLLITALTTDGFAAETWGVDFWTNIKSNYADALKAAGDSRGSIAAGSGSLATMMKQINKVNSALRFVLRGNYPETFQQVYRDWGWQKESF